MTDRISSQSSLSLRTIELAVDGQALQRLLQQPWPAVTLKAGRREAKHMFEAARSIAEPGLTLTMIEPALQQLLMLSVVRLPAPIAAALKGWRQSTAAVRSLWCVFGEGHVPPASFENFVRIFGRLNDAIAAKDGGKARDEARDLMIEARAGEAFAAVDTFKPTGRPETVSFLEEQRSDVEDAVGRDAIDAEHFHEVRKALKHFMNAMKFQQIIYPDEATAALAQRTLELNTILGNVQDQMTQRQVLASLDPRDVDVILPRELAAVVTALFGALTL